MAKTMDFRVLVGLKNHLCQDIRGSEVGLERKVLENEDDEV